MRTISVWCDACNADSAQTAGQTVRLVLNDGQPQTLDLCDKHQATLIEPLSQLLADYGAPVTTEDARSAASETPASTPAKADCPACGDTLNQTSLAAHIYRSHLRTPKPVLHVCPDCGWTPSSAIPTEAQPRAVGRHRSATHGTTTATDALAALAALSAPQRTKRAPRKARAS
jgi:predicted RNA-binding Zn-ribbon protein involved in translation (DUF1610 family)